MSLIPENISRLLSDYTFEVDSDFENEELKCIICKKLINDVFQSHCGCNFCSQCISNYLTEENKYCPGGKSDCQERYLVLGSYVSRNPKLNKQVLRTRVHCPYDSCLYVSELINIGEHMRVCDKLPSDCPYSIVGCKHKKESIDKVTDHLNIKLFAHSKLLNEFVGNIENEMNDLKSEIRILKEELRRKEESKQKEVEEEIEKSKKTINELNEKIELLNRGINNTVAFGEIYLTVDKFCERKKNEETVFSRYFYSHVKGYKLRLEVYLAGRDAHKGTHLTVYAVICKGGYDDILSWPCKYSLKISVVNQWTKEEQNIVSLDYSTAPLSVRERFNKPVSNYNVIYGFSPFISHRDLDSIDGLKVDDTVIIKCVVIAPS